MSDSTPNATPQPAPNDPAKTGYDPAARWSNYFNILTGRMTREGQAAMREDLYIKHEARDCRQCEEWRDYMFAYSPIVRFMSQKITALNGKLDAANVQCRRCSTFTDGAGQLARRGGGFHPDHGIQICANEMRSRGHLEDTLTHEMVHAYDHLRFKVDWADLRHAACSEIRASSLSGECRWAREFFTRQNFTITQQHQACVRMRAVRSVMNRPSCKDDVQAVKVVNEVWDSCYSDTRPFDEIYK